MSVHITGLLFDGFVFCSRFIWINELIIVHFTDRHELFNYPQYILSYTVCVALCTYIQETSMFTDHNPLHYNGKCSLGPMTSRRVINGIIGNMTRMTKPNSHRSRFWQSGIGLFEFLMFFIVNYVKYLDRYVNINGMKLLYICNFSVSAAIGNKDQCFIFFFQELLIWFLPVVVCIVLTYFYCRFCRWCVCLARQPAIFKQRILHVNRYIRHAYHDFSDTFLSCLCFELQMVVWHW